MKSTIATSILLLATASAASLRRAGLRPCTQAEVALATGIHLNIEGQYGEYNATVNVENVEQQQPFPWSDFYDAKGKLQSNVQTGMNIRLFNQQIAPPGNPAIPGLAQYQAAEEYEKDGANELTGFYEVDKPVIEALKTNITKGIALNERNLAAAVSECDFTLVFPPADESGS